MSLVNPPEFRQVELTCECRINGERLYTTQVVLEMVYNDPVARKAVEEMIRQRLMMGILDKWKPKIQVRR